MPVACPFCKREFENERGVSCHIGKIHKKDRSETSKHYQKTDAGVTRQTPKSAGYRKMVPCPTHHAACDNERGATAYMDSIHRKDSKGTGNWFNDKRRNKTFPCPICSKEFDSERGVSIHIGKSHEDPQRFGSKDEHFVIDKRTPKDHKTKSFSCPICNEDFDCQRKVSYHIGKVHEEPTQHRHNDDRDYRKKNFPLSEDPRVEREFSLLIGNMHPDSAKCKSKDKGRFSQMGHSCNSTGGSRDKIEEMPVFCHICKERCKNERGLQIHLGRMHRDFPVGKYEDEVQRFKSPGKGRSDSGFETASCSSGARSRLMEDINDNKLSKQDVSEAANAVNSFIGKFKEKLEEHCAFDILKSGSYYDKTKNKMPDEFDYMFFPKSISVKPVYEGASSGYCKLEIRSLPRELDFRVETETETGKFLDPTKFKKFIFSIFDQILADKSFRQARTVNKKERPDDSPAYTIIYKGIPGKELDIDLVPCIRIDGWPDVADSVNPKWLKNNELRTDCMKCYHVVAKTCPDRIQDASLMWRLSFSSAEKILIKHANMGNEKSFRKAIFKCLKATLEETKTENPDRIKKFCSYHLKMFMLHRFDDAEYQRCEVDEVSLTLYTINHLITALSDRQIQNYFIPTDNVIRAVPKMELGIVLKGFLKKHDYLQSKGRQ